MREIRFRPGSYISAGPQLTVDYITELKDVLAYDLDGSMHDGFPIAADQPFFSAQLTADLDGDGDLEVV